MSENQDQHFRPSFSTLGIDSQGPRVTVDGSLFLVRELDKRWGLSTLITENIKGSPFHV